MAATAAGAAVPGSFLTAIPRRTRQHRPRFTHGDTLGSEGDMAWAQHTGPEPRSDSASSSLQAAGQDLGAQPRAWADPGALTLGERPWGRPSSLRTWDSRRQLRPGPSARGDFWCEFPGGPGAWPCASRAAGTEAGSFLALQDWGGAPTQRPRAEASQPPGPRLNSTLAPQARCPGCAAATLPWAPPRRPSICPGSGETPRETHGRDWDPACCPPGRLGMDRPGCRASLEAAGPALNSEDKTAPPAA